MGTRTVNNDCDLEGLSALVRGPLEQGTRAALEQHLQACPTCRRQLRRLQTVDQLLGQPAGRHPGADQLSSFAAGELEGDRLAALEQHLGSCLPCRRLAQAAEAGLQELQRLLQQQPQAHTVLVLPAAPPLRAAAAGVGLDNPAPEDRQVLQQAAGHRLVYYRQGPAGVLALFWDPGQPVHVHGCTLEHRALEPEPTEGGVIYQLGLAGELWGKTLEINLDVGDGPRPLSWTVVQA